MNNDMIYQIRVPAGESPEDVVTALTQAAWTALPQLKSLRGADPHYWPRLHRDFLEVFKGRLLSHKECGTLHECRYSIGMYGGALEGAIPSGFTYILTLRGGLLRFVEGLSALVCRRFKESPRREKSFRRKEMGLIQGALHRALAPYLYYNEGCFRCLVRTERPERRIWSSRGEAPVEGLKARWSGEVPDGGAAE